MKIKFSIIFALIILAALTIPKTIQSAVTTNGLRAFWTFDNNDYNGSTMPDKSGFGNDLVKQGAAAIVPGKIKQAANFSALTDNFTVTSTGVGDFTKGTITAWINPRTNSGGSGCNSHNGSGACRAIIWNDPHGYFFGVNTDGALILDLGDGVGSWLVIDNTAAGQVVTNKWQFVAVTVAGTAVTYYLDGKKIVTNTVAANSGLKNSQSPRVGVGGTLFGNTYGLDGLLDEVRVYSRALSGAEILGIYNAAPVTRVASSATIKGLVGHWTLDSNDIIGASIQDKSATAQVGTAPSGTSTMVTGVLRQGRHFARGNDDINLGTNTAFDLPSLITYSLWFRTNTTGVNQALIVRETSGAERRGLQIRTGNMLRMHCQDASNNFANADTTATVTDGKWHMATGVRNGNTVKLYLDGVMASSSMNTSMGACSPAAVNNRIGRRSNLPFNYFTGDMDDVRIYNIELSSAEIFNLYKTSKLSRSFAASDGGFLQGFWTMDNGDFNGLTMFDKSGYANNAESTGASIVPGKIKQAASLNGTSNYLQVANSVSFSLARPFMTVSLWAKQNSLSVNKTMMAQWNYQTDGAWSLGVSDTTSTVIQVNIPSSQNQAVGIQNIYSQSGAWSANVWHHVVFTFNGTQTGNTNRLKLYIDGVKQTVSTSGTIPSIIHSTAAPINIGQFGGTLTNYWNGSIDDVRVYNRTLNAAEVNQLYRATAIRTK